MIAFLCIFHLLALFLASQVPFQLALQQQACVNSSFPVNLLYNLTRGAPAAARAARGRLPQPRLARQRLLQTVAGRRPPDWPAAQSLSCCCCSGCPLQLLQQPAAGRQPRPRLACRRLSPAAGLAACAEPLPGCCCCSLPQAAAAGRNSINMPNMPAVI